MNRTLVLLGPTAVGKSALGMTIAQSHNGEIVSFDALQVYRRFDIGTAKPSPADQNRVRHHLIDVCDPTEQLNAASLAGKARQAVAEIKARGHLAILVGGSGMYLRSILHGLSPIPPIEPEIRRNLKERLRSKGLEALRQELEAVDPRAAKRIEVGDSQRTLRALEVFESTGSSIIEWQSISPPEKNRIEAVQIGLTLPRSVLYDRIERRVRSMLEQGWLEEVETLLAEGLSPRAPAFQAIGYRQLAAHLGGMLTYEQALEEIVQATRRYSKRQMTWFRRDTDIRWISVENSRGAIREIEQLMETMISGGENG